MCIQGSDGQNDVLDVEYKYTSHDPQMWVFSEYYVLFLISPHQSCKRTSKRIWLCKCLECSCVKVSRHLDATLTPQG